jgi:hypothetical protein
MKQAIPVHPLANTWPYPSPPPPSPPHSFDPDLSIQIKITPQQAQQVTAQANLRYIDLDARNMTMFHYNRFNCAMARADEASQQGNVCTSTSDTDGGDFPTENISTALLSG